MKNYLYNLATDRSKGLIAGILKFFLFLFSLLYAFAIKILSSWNLRNAVRLNCKVISVGNITLGGTGKTTLVEYIAKILKENGHKVAILTRGYGRNCIEKMGDEPSMLAGNLKDVSVLVDSDRIRSAHKAIEDHCVDTVILDDGMQQWKIKKDLEIVTIDSLSLCGNRQLIPRGILREPLSALKRADIFLLTKVNLNPQIEQTKSYLRQINPKAEIFSSLHQPVGFYELAKKEELSDPLALKGKNVTLFSGIGDPDSFENLISSLGINIGL
ncbi:MAG: tetraacyldisaccharide 4'-kinase, partial [Candidatus Omnitrophica bacterium]|nr:tetraacyldisaccharide 4'-kinase [Candidatus Omnitrophota bacterium]